MKEEYYRWRTPYLNKNFEMLVFGHAGIPVVFFPEANGHFYDAKESGLIEAARDLIDTGGIKVYCPEVNDTHSWLSNESAHEKLRLHQAYERVIMQEVVKKAQFETHRHRVIFIGIGWGAYHAINTAFRHPEIAGYAFSISGEFQIRKYLGEHFDETCYYNSPLDFINGMHEGELLNQVREMGVAIGTPEHYAESEQTKTLSKILASKKISHWLDIHRGEYNHWDLWKQMFVNYLTLAVDKGCK
jgi:esterase/lipase superfamily enzyme